MNKHYTTSIALCTYNGERFIQKQLHSLFNQSIKPTEIIIVDDCSTDKTFELLQSLQLNSPIPIQLFKNKQRLGFIKNFEKAIHLCSSDIVFLCDQDDIWHTHKVEEVVNTFNKDKNIDLICHNSTLTDFETKEHHNLWHSLAFEQFVEQPIYPNKVLERLLIFGNCCSGHTMALKKEQFQLNLVDGHPIQMPHDYQILFYFLMYGTVFFLNKPLVQYRLHDKQTIGLHLNTREDLLKAYKRYERKDRFYFGKNWIAKHIVMNVLNQSSLQKDLLNLLNKNVQETNKEIAWFLHFIEGTKLDLLLFKLYTSFKSLSKK